MEFNDVTYIAPSNLFEIAQSPYTDFLSLVFALLVSMMALFEISGLLHAFSMAKIGRKTNVHSMFLAGIRTSLKAFIPENWLVILFVLVLFPLTKIIPISNSTFKLILPGFVNQTIDYTQSLKIIYNVVYLIVLIVAMVYAFSIHFFVLEKGDFINSCKKSRMMGKKNYINTFLSLLILMVIMNIIFNSLSSLISMNVTEVISSFNKTISNTNKARLLGKLTYIIKQTFMSLMAPMINIAGFSVLFYRYVDKYNLSDSISEDSFYEIQLSKGKRIAIDATILLFFVGYGLYLSDKYSFVKEAVNEPLVCAHRGDNVHAPENTLDAFELAASEGLSWIELDVHQTSDGVVVCNHDSDILRTTGINYKIHEHTYDD